MKTHLPRSAAASIAAPRSVAVVLHVETEDDLTRRASSLVLRRAGRSPRPRMARSIQLDSVRRPVYSLSARERAPIAWLSASATFRCVTVVPTDSEGLVRRAWLLELHAKLKARSRTWLAEPRFAPALELPRHVLGRTEHRRRARPLLLRPCHGSRPRPIVDALVRGERVERLVLAPDDSSCRRTP